MWSCAADTLAAGACRYVPRRHGAALPFAEVLRLWREDDGFASFLTGVLAEAPFAAFRWECPSVSAPTAAMAFEFVLSDAPELLVPADPEPFREHWDREHWDREHWDREHWDRAEIVVFDNLGGDARLVVPIEVGPAAAYASLAAFLRGARRSQVRTLWAAIGTELRDRLGPAPVWVSTAGNGVPWLHVRVDTRPKYYVHAPYRAPRRHVSLAARAPDP